MNSKKILALILSLCLIFALCACGAANNGNSSGGSPNNSNTEPSEKDLTPPEISEKAMDNFVKKLQAGNYTVDTEGYADTVVVSPEQVHIDFKFYDRPVTYAYMTLKGETFEAMIDDGVIDDVYYNSTDTAVEAAGFILPNYWIEASGGSMFELFYNNVEKPLEFTSNDETVKTTLAALAGMNEFALQRMEEVCIEFDAMDPASVHFTAVVPDDESGRHYYDDLDLTIKFGEAKSDPTVDKWLSDPVYPPVRTAWTKSDIGELDLAFMRDYGKDAVPFPGVASYAMNFDKDAYNEFNGIYLSDAHLTEKDVEDYKALLKSNGFTETTGKLADGSEATVYRKLLREAFNAYSQLYVAYDDGFTVEGTLYYECPEYEGREAISKAVEEYGFSPLPETDVFTGWTAVESSGPQAEAWAYAFEYDFFMSFGLNYKDRAAAKEYLSGYVDQLISDGFKEIYQPGEDNRKAGNSNESVTFHYTLPDEEDDTGIAQVWFKDERTIPVDQVLEILKEHGFPDTDIHGDILARDGAKYQYQISGFEGVRLYIYQPYDSIEQIEKYLDVYTAGLEDLDYLPTNPQSFSSNRQFLYFNEELRKYVAFDINPNDDGSATLFYEMVSFESPLDSMMTKQLRLNK